MAWSSDVYLACQMEMDSRRSVSVSIVVGGLSRSLHSSRSDATAHRKAHINASRLCRKSRIPDPISPPLELVSFSTTTARHHLPPHLWLLLLLLLLAKLHSLDTALPTPSLSHYSRSRSPSWRNSRISLSMTMHIHIRTPGTWSTCLVILYSISLTLTVSLSC